MLIGRTKIYPQKMTSAKLLQPFRKIIDLNQVEVMKKSLLAVQKDVNRE